MASRLLQRALTQTSNACKRSLQKTGRRTILSQAHTCQDVWEERLQSSVLQKVDVGEFALRIQENIERGTVQSIDMDVLANKLDVLDNQQLDFVQNLFYRFRRTNETIYAKDSMSHAVVRALVKFGEVERLLRILKDKVGYGIFLDDFSANFLLDHLIKKELYYEAAQVAYDMMLQEDLAHPVVRHLAWYACDKYWRTAPQTPEETEGAEQQDEEDVWIPVKFIRHPWYDDHWDIHRDSLLLGKTFTLITAYEDGLLGTSYRLLGLGLHEKFDQGLDLMTQWAASQDQTTVAREAVAGFLSVLGAVETREPPAEDKEAGMLTMDDVLPYITAQQKEDLTQRAKGCIHDLESRGKVVDEPLQPLLKERVEKLTVGCEAQDITDQQRVYRRWEAERQDDIQTQIDTANNLQKRRQIAERLKELQAKEEKLSYFEQQEKIMLGVSRAPKFRPIEDVQEEEQFVAPPTERGRSY